MDKYFALTEFLLRLIKVQIEKYTGLATIGVGPDAGINGHLVVEEVNELIRFTELLIQCIHEQHDHDDIFSSVLSQTQFYINQEHLRGYAGWLIDENNIHTTEFKRLQQYKSDLGQLIDEHGITNIQEPTARNNQQQQCEHDSRSIAFKITNLVIALKANPEMALDETLAPHHAKIILRRHAKAGGRYDNPELYGQIKRLHSECDQFLSESPFTTRSQKLLKNEAGSLRQAHERQLNELLRQYQQHQPTSSLFSDKPEWYQIAGVKSLKIQTGSLTQSHGLFSNRTAAMLSVGAVAIVMLIYNLLAAADITSSRLTR